MTMTETTETAAVTSGNSNTDWENIGEQPIDYRDDGARQLCALMLKDTHSVERWIEDGHPAACDFGDYAQLAAAIRETWTQHHVLLTRDAYKLFLEGRIEKKMELIAALGRYSNCYIIRSRPDISASNYHVYVAQMATKTEKATRVAIAKSLQADNIDEVIRLAQNLKTLRTGTDDDAEAEETAAQYEPVTYRMNQLPSSIKTVADYLSTVLGEEACVTAVMAAIWLTAAAVGKRIRFVNRGNTYYPNLFVALLRPSGKNKSGYATRIAELAEHINPRTDTPSAMTMQALMARYGTTIKRGEGEDAAKTDMVAKIKQAAYEHKKNLDGEAVIVDEFRAMIGELIPQQETTKHAQLFCRLAENGRIDTDTITRGARVIGDACVNLLGLSQSDPYNSEMRTAAFQAGGVSARILPVNPEQFHLQDYLLQPRTCMEAATALEAIRSLAIRSANIEDRINVTFGTGDDPLGEAKAKFASLPRVKFFLEDNPAVWQVMESKILVQSAKVAALLALAEAVDGIDPMDSPKVQTLDASKWLPVAYTLVGHLHISNTYHVAKLTAQAEQQERVLHLLKRAGKDSRKATRRYLVMATDYPAWLVDQITDMLIADGVVERRKTPSGRSIYYHLVPKSKRN